jgi:hypothetical protein
MRFVAHSASFPTDVNNVLTRFAADDLPVLEGAVRLAGEVTADFRKPIARTLKKIVTVQGVSM